MARWTARDRVWNVALRKDGEFRPRELADALDVGERTVRDCLNCMAEESDSSPPFLERIGGEGTDPVRFRSLVDLE